MYTYGLYTILLEAPPRFELGIRVLQTHALPLGYSAVLERITRLELATSTLARWRSTRWAKSALKNMKSHILWCLRSESNQRHGDFQSPALPTELQRQIKATRIGLEPTTPSVTGWCSNQLSYRATWWKLTGSNRWPSACKADALPTELNLQYSWDIPAVRPMLKC